MPDYDVEIGGKTVTITADSPEGAARRAYAQSKTGKLPGFETPAQTTGQRLIRGAAPSVVGGALGAGIGTLIAPGPGTIIGGMLGSAGGEAVTQFLDPLNVGIKEPSLAQVGVAGALPIVPTALRRFFVSLPGAAAGLQEFLLGKLGSKGEKVIEQFAPAPGTASRLFEAAKASGTTLTVPLTKTAQVTADVAAEVAKSQFAASGARALVARAKAFTRTGAASFEEMRLNQSDLGAVVRSLEAKEGAALGRAKQLYGAMWDDLNAALQKAPGPTGQQLRGALDAYKREEAAKFFKDAFGKSVTRRVGQRNIDVDTFMTRIDRHRDVLQKLMPAKDIDDALAVVEGFAKIPVMAKTPRLGFEQMPFAARAVVGGAVGAGVEAAGGGSGVMGAASGVLLVEGISVALTTKAGRSLVKSLMERGATWDQIGNILLQSGRAAVTPAMTPESPPQ